jgi:hypothetical protein
MARSWASDGVLEIAKKMLAALDSGEVCEEAEVVR